MEAPKVVEKKVYNIPPYGQRANYIPRRREDYGDGGAFPEIHIAQYPLDMGRSEVALFGILTCLRRVVSDSSQSRVYRQTCDIADTFGDIFGLIVPSSEPLVPIHRYGNNHIYPAEKSRRHQLASKLFG